MKSLLVLALTIAAAFAANDKPKMTKAEHKAEAARHSTRAEAHAAKAKTHEAAADRIKARRGYNAMQYKWPALAMGAENAERDRAAAARRAETEALELAAFHTAMAEKSADAEP